VAGRSTESLDGFQLSGSIPPDQSVLLAPLPRHFVVQLLGRPPPRWYSERGLIEKRGGCPLPPGFFPDRWTSVGFDGYWSAQRCNADGLVLLSATRSQSIRCSLVCLLFTLTIAYAIWVLFMDGATKVREFELLSAFGMRGIKPMSERVIKITAALGPPFFVFWIWIAVSQNTPLPK
jgi:hypothetical protein